MSYLSFEDSIFSGAPVELYRFYNGPQTWLYTSSAYEVTYNGELYQPYPMSRNDIVQTKDYNKSMLEITTARDLPLVADFLANPPDGATLLTVYREHAGDGNYIIYWQGRIVSVDFMDSESTLKCEPVFTSMRGTGLRAKYSTGCGHVLYGPGCTVPPANFQASGTLTAVSGVTLTATVFGTHSDGWWSGGKIVATINGITGARMIASHTGNNIVLMTPLLGLAVGSTFSVYPGCDHSLGICNSKFNNVLNYGGFPWKPQVNPFNGTSL